MTSQWSGLALSCEKQNTYLHLKKMYEHHIRQSAAIALEAPKQESLIKWTTWGHVTVWKILIFMRFIANKLVRLLTLGRIFSMQSLKLSPTSSTFSFSFSPSWQDFGRIGNFFANVLLLVAFNACELVFTGKTSKWLCQRFLYCHFRCLWPTAQTSARSWTWFWRLLSKQEN